MLGAWVKAESVRDPGRPVRHLHVGGEREQESILGKKMGANSRCWVSRGIARPALVTSGHQRLKKMRGICL